MATSKTVVASFPNGHRTVARMLYQYDYGQTILFDGLDLPMAYEVHFANSEFKGETKTSIGGADGAIIPDEYLETGEPIYAWVYLHEGENDGETRYVVEIPVRRRPEPTNEEPTPVQQDTITQAIAALQAAVDQTGADVEAAGQSAEDAAASAEDAAASEEAANRHAADAATSANAASESAQYTGEQAAIAETKAQDAARYAGEAAQSAEDADMSADRAEQAAAEAGWMAFEVLGGELWMERTRNVTVDFSLSDGELIMEAV